MCFSETVSDRRLTKLDFSDRMTNDGLILKRSFLRAFIIIFTRRLKIHVHHGRMMRGDDLGDAPVGKNRNIVLGFFEIENFFLKVKGN